MRFIVFVIDSSTRTASGYEREEIDAFNESLQQRGYWVTAAGIGAPSTATLIDNRAGAGLVQGGSLIDSADFYSGFWIIDVPDAEIAQSVAEAGSRACNRRVELRPFLQ